MDIYVPVASKQMHGSKTPKLREEPPFDIMIEEEKGDCILLLITRKFAYVYDQMRVTKV